MRYIMMLYKFLCVHEVEVRAIARREWLSKVEQRVCKFMLLLPLVSMTSSSI